MTSENATIYKVDAAGQSLGRIASDIAFHLRDKHLPSFTPNKPGTTVVEVENVDKIRITGNKLEVNKIYRHSGFPGGLKYDTWKQLIKENPAKLLEHAVHGMLPANRLRNDAMKRLKIKKS